MEIGNLTLNSRFGLDLVRILGDLDLTILQGFSVLLVSESEISIFCSLLSLFKTRLIPDDEVVDPVLSRSLLLVLFKKFVLKSKVLHGRF